MESVESHYKAAHQVLASACDCFFIFPNARFLIIILINLINVITSPKLVAV